MMKDKLFMISLISMTILAAGCNKGKHPLLEKNKSRAQAEASIKEVEKLEREMQRVQELERLEKESERITQRKESVAPPTEFSVEAPVVDK